MLAEHIVATTRGHSPPLVRPDLASWLWEHLSAQVPRALSFVLMPDHFHLMAPPGRVDRVRRVITGFTKSFGVRMDVAAAERASTRKILGRQVRYGLYNPVRAGLVDDPWCWRWSTLRDLGTACYPVWTPLPRIARSLQLPPQRALRGISHLGEHRPTPPRAGPIEVASSNQVLHAVASTLRQPVTALPHLRLGRRLTVQTAAHVDHPLSTAQLAQLLDISPRTVQRLRQDPHPALTAAVNCLSDDRLR